ncbi:hypothetical protein H4R34_003815 [Dimargaris verticillata]|uniref:DIS3-like exonuclease 1 n=1 Tax=Dimargaris verticillata TaxID=2761393 RepID=A0A9W8EC95_9FUNG|nr:hypothetical protein H4R34_003815 [Dimargaris verticillata]
MAVFRQGLDLHYRKARGTVVKQVTEHYVRTDIPCLSPKCPQDLPCYQRDARHLAQALLNKDASHYCIPSTAVIARYAELLEQPELQSLIFCQTALQTLYNHDRARTCRMVRRIINDPRRHSILFYNATFAETQAPRRPAESLAANDQRALIIAGQWYRSHLSQVVPVVIVVDTGELSDYQALATADATGVTIVAITNYLQTYIGEASALNELFISIRDATEAELDMANGVLSTGIDKKPLSLYRAYPAIAELERQIKSGALLKGTLRVRARQRNSALVQTILPNGTDITVAIQGQQAINRALQGDTVAIQLVDRQQVTLSTDQEDSDGSDSSDAETELTPDQAVHYGQVIGVLKRHWRSYVATIQQDGDQGLYHLAIPLDPVIPKIRIRYHEVRLILNQRIVVRIDDWPLDSMYPQGHFVRALGEVHSLDAEIDAILVEHGIATSQSSLAFSSALLRELPEHLPPEHPWQPSTEEIARRRDLRTTHTIFSIDPPNCQDIDDAMSVRQLQPGLYELGVHIADVSFFVPAQSHTDIEARARATTVYLADRRFNMLPAVLSEGICSLHQGVDRYAVSVIWQMDEQGYIFDCWYGRTVIQSCAALEYQQAQALLDGKQHDPALKNIDASLATRLKPCLALLAQLLGSIRRRRFARGALSLDSTEVKFEFAPTNHAIEEVKTKETLLIHRIVEEAMVTANAAVGAYLYQCCQPLGLLRRHPPPVPSHFDRLLKVANAKKSVSAVAIDSSTNLSLARSLDILGNTFRGEREIIRLLKAMATRAMSEAGYLTVGQAAGPQDLAHYGLAVDYYTHFTSPIRRYADLVVHRQLLAALATATDKTSQTLPSEATALPRAVPINLRELCDHLNERTRAAKRAQSDSTELFQGLYVYQRTRASGSPLLVQAVVSEILPRGLRLWVPRYGIQGVFYWETKEGEMRIPRSLITGNPDDDEDWVLSAKVSLRSSSGHSPSPQDELHSPKGSFNAVQVDFLGQRSRPMVIELFDRVQVSLKVIPSPARRHNITISLIGPERRALGTRQPPKPQSSVPSSDTPPINTATIRALESEHGSTTTAHDARQDVRHSDSIYELIRQFSQFSVIHTTAPSAGI